MTPRFLSLIVTRTPLVLKWKEANLPPDLTLYMPSALFPFHSLEIMSLLIITLAWEK